MKHNKEIQHINEYSWYGLFYDQVKQDKRHIRRIDMVPMNVNQCQVYMYGDSVYASKDFYPGDIIEVCPTKPIEKELLFSRDIREIVFEVIPNEEYVIPFGYCQYYDIISKYAPESNCDYTWDADQKVIVIRAIQRITKGSKLVLDIRK